MDGMRERKRERWRQTDRDKERKRKKRENNRDAEKIANKERRERERKERSERPGLCTKHYAIVMALLKRSNDFAIWLRIVGHFRDPSEPGGSRRQPFSYFFQCFPFM